MKAAARICRKTETGSRQAVLSWIEHCLADADRATDNAKTREVFAAIPHLSHGTVPGQHGVQFDAPREIVAHVLGFVDRLRR